MPDFDWLSFFIDSGISVIPLREKEKKPAIKWKRYTEEKLAKEKVEEILEREGSENVGVICGEVSGNLVVLDIDNAELFEKLSLGEVASETLTVRTAKGYHIYIKFSDSEREAIDKWIGEKGVKTLYYPPKKKGKIDESHEEIRFQYNDHYVVGPACYSADTRIFTEEGLKTYNEISFNDNIATLNANGQFEFQRPTNIYQYQYTGDMILFEGQRYNLFVTPNHNMYVRSHWKKNAAFELIRADKLLNAPKGGIQLKRNADWSGSDNILDFKLPPIEEFDKLEKATLRTLKYTISCLLKERYGFGAPRVSKVLRLPQSTVSFWLANGPRNSHVSAIQNDIEHESIEIDRGLAFLGWFLAEGNVAGESIVSISQLNLEERHVNLVSYRLHKLLSAFGNSWEKFIPRNIKELPTEKLNILLGTLNKGDGSKNGLGYTYSTSSKRLANDVIEIGIKCGYSATIWEGRGNKRTQYYINLGVQSKTPAMYTPPKIEKYNGVVWCVEVPNHVVLVERGGKLQWSGNSIHPSGTKYEALPTSPKCIREAKGVGLLEEIERRWKSYRKVKKRGEKILEEPLLDFIKRYVNPKDVVDSGDYIQMWSPFHKGTSPTAFTIYKSDNHWYDFSEELGGRHPEFLMRLKGISREEANAELGIEEGSKRKGAIGGNYVTTIQLEDGRYAEEVLRDDREMFVLYDSATDSWEYAGEIDQNGEKILPLPLFPNQRNSITLADGVEEYGTLRDLRSEMLEFGLAEFDPVDNKELFKLAIHLELTSWIASERMKGLAERFIPIIAVRGPSETGKKRFLTISRWLAYRPLYVLKTTRVPTLFRALAPWGGTLILDEADLADSSESSEFIEFMNSRADGVPIPRYSSGDKTVEFFHSFGTSIVAERSSSTDDGYESRKVIFPSDATNMPEKYSLIPSKDWVERGKALQRKLLLFRLRHLVGDVPTNLVIDGVKGFRVRESLLLLQALSDEDSEITKDISLIAKKLEKRIIIERSGSVEGLILNIVYNVIADADTYLEPHGKALEIIVTQRHEKGDETTYPLTLKYVSKGLGEVISVAEVARRWRGLGQDTTPRGRREGKRYSGIIQISNPQRFLKEIGKYVVDVDYGELREKMGAQKGIGDWGTK